MKAAYASGVLTAFEQAGYWPWDLVVGTSAGGALAAWAAAGQAEFAEGTWAYASDPRILSYGRWLRRQGPALDHDALFRLVYEDEHPLDVAAVASCPTPVHVTVADIHEGRCHYPDIRQGAVIDWLRATGRLPFAAGDPVEIGGRAYLDGGILDPIPLRWVLAQGATEVTLIRNKPDGVVKKDSRLLLELASRRYPRLRQGLLDHQKLKQDAAALARHPPEGVTVQVVQPTTDTGVSRMTRDQDLLNAALQRGRVDGARHVANRGEGLQIAA